MRIQILKHNPDQYCTVLKIICSAGSYQNSKRFSNNYTGAAVVTGSLALFQKKTLEKALEKVRNYGKICVYAKYNLKF